MEHANGGIDWLHNAALAAYRMINPDGPAFSTLSKEDRDRWRDAYGVARAIEPTVLTCDTQISLNSATFEYARSLLGEPPLESITIYAGPYCRSEAYALVARHGCRYIELPGKAFKTQWTWVLRSLDGAFFSMPCD